jgi:hypothetical protein
MRAGLLPALAGTLAVVLLGSLAAAQDQPPTPPPPPAQAAVPLTPEQLDQLTAPIALYPDPLLGQILMAATYPLEVVEADRWLQQPGNATLKGDQLAAALAQQSWDPSVKSLVAFPQILRMMDGNVTWTEQLGDAFLAAQAAVMDSVQRLRGKAEAAGRLKSTPQQVVANDGGTIVIEPPGPNQVYVPVYDPNAVYGPWPYPDYPPYSFPDFSPDVAIGPSGFGWFDVGTVALLWRWNRLDWRGHRIDIDPHRFNALNTHRPWIASGIWQHDPSHRGGVRYRDPAVSARFQGAATAAMRRSFRDFAAAAPAPAWPTVNPAPLSAMIGARAPALRIERGPAALSPRLPAVLRPTPPVLQSFHRGADARIAAQRAQSSRITMWATRSAAPALRAAAPAGRAAAAPQGRVGRR